MSWGGSQGGGGLVGRNAVYIWSQLCAATSTCSGFVQGFSLLLTLGYFLSYFEDVMQYVAVTPRYIMPPNFYIWTAVTHCIFEDRILMVLGDMVAMSLCGKMMEPLWGNLEMLSFFLIVNVSTAFLTVVYFILLYSLSWDTEYLFTVRIHGMAGYNAAIMVAVKQMMPDHVLFTLASVGKLRNRNLPLTVLFITIILWAIGGLRGIYPVMFTAGTLSSWIYLRFFQHHSNGSRGDVADHFCFASFFPNVLQPPVAVLCNAIFELFVKCGVCSRPIRKYNIASSSASSSSISIHIPRSTPGPSGDDAERRKQLALKALNERLAKGALSKSPSSPQIPQVVVNPNSSPSRSGSTKQLVDI